MSDIDSPAMIVARFLKSNNYDDTLDAFISEARLPPDAGSVADGDLTIEKVLEEKKTFDLSRRIEKVSIGDGNRNWSLPAPSTPSAIEINSPPSNMLHVSIEELPGLDPSSAHVLCATTADRNMRLYSLDGDVSPIKSLNTIHDSPVLSCISPLPGQPLMISSSMSGQVILYDYQRDVLVDQRRDHKKYVVKVAAYRVTDDAGAECLLVATAGWDGRVLLYKTTSTTTQALVFGDPVADITLPTNPECILFVNHPDLGQGHPALVVTRRDSTSLHYYDLSKLTTTETNRSDAVPSRATDLPLLGTQNLAPHSNAWIAFSPSSIALSPTDPTLLAVATSAVPHMKLILVRMLIPPSSTEERPSSNTTQDLTQAAQARSELARQDREEAAIQVHVSTSAPQTAYSTPQVVWRPDGTGVWVNGDDGVVRGLETKTGKIVAALREGHEAGSKIRSVWCGYYVDFKGVREEVVVSGGFDRRLVLWRRELAREYIR